MLSIFMNEQVLAYDPIYKALVAQSDSASDF